MLGALSPEATLYRPGEASYEALSIPFNHRYADIRPAAVLAAGTVGDIQAAVRGPAATGWA